MDAGHSMRAVKGNLATLPGREEKKYDSQFRVVFDAIRELMEEPEPKVRRIGFKTQPLEHSRSLRTDLTDWANLQDLEEGRAVPRREPVA
jgi:hypothetical protein